MCLLQYGKRPHADENKSGEGCDDEREGAEGCSEKGWGSEHEQDGSVSNEEELCEQ